MTQARETYEAAFQWGSEFQAVFANALIDGNTIDSGNTPTFELRPGLLLGQVLSTGKYKNYSPTATDGSEVASAILMEAIRTLDFSNNATDRFYAVLVGGPVQASKVLNLDLMARQQMDNFIFDDSLGFGSILGNHWWPWKRFQTKTANYSVVASDNFSLFDNTGAGGAVTYTLPSIANGYFFGFRVQTDQNVIVQSLEGSNVIALNNASATSVAFQTGSGRIGGMFYIYSNPAANKWIVENASAGSNTITVA
jgi:hypothetical protein